MGLWAHINGQIIPDFGDTNHLREFCGMKDDEGFYDFSLYTSGRIASDSTQVLYLLQEGWDRIIDEDLDSYKITIQTHDDENGGFKDVKTFDLTEYMIPNGTELTKLHVVPTRIIEGFPMYKEILIFNICGNIGDNYIGTMEIEKWWKFMTAIFGSNGTLYFSNLDGNFLLDGFGNKHKLDKPYGFD